MNFCPNCGCRSCKTIQGQRAFRDAQDLARKERNSERRQRDFMIWMLSLSDSMSWQRLADLFQRCPTTMHSSVSRALHVLRGNVWRRRLDGDPVMERLEKAGAISRGLDRNEFYFGDIEDDFDSADKRRKRRREAGR